MTSAAAAPQALTEVLRAGGGSVAERVDRALALLLEQLGMQVSYVSVFRGDDRVVTHSRSVPHGPVLPAGTAHPVAETLCHLVATGRLEPLVADARRHPLIASHPHTGAFGIRGYASVPLRLGGRVAGAVCVASTAPAPGLGARDENILRAVAGHVADLLGDVRDTEPGDPAAPPGARSLATADLEAVTRPLLRLMQQATGLEATYLTLHDEATDELVVTYADETADLGFAEGTSVSWPASLCRRTIGGGGACVTDVQERWADCAVARQAGVNTWVSVPVRDHEGRLIGTLCGGSRADVPLDGRAESVVRGVAGLIAEQLAREAAHLAATSRARDLQQRVEILRDSAERDPLTGLANRAGITRWMTAALPRLRGDDRTLMVAFLDLDGFKPVNDTYGHAVGDEVLRLFGERLQAVGRAEDLRGRLGGDEFVIAAVLPAAADRHGWASRVRGITDVLLGDIRVTASLGVAAVTDPATDIGDLIHRADEAMYRDKQQRHALPAPC
ncbi:diguanylate cyclase [Actinoplanes teichomyceticus]|uniref:Diguanylate cyclase (GGDEF)-like protein n=1 Tax=Actinoplanes teichomyceticus TaxID=1867 RepID=A0A561VCT6_ACTTI|nr:diguanylate cyclase [Actinoplanes teichomyceticus]TWG09420.1 diguanylate cyclase (GGDEF)-like protein [Actinoplanes teichomyceticus]